MSSPFELAALAADLTADPGLAAAAAALATAPGPDPRAMHPWGLPQVMVDRLREAIPCPDDCECKTDPASIDYQPEGRQSDEGTSP